MIHVTCRLTAKNRGISSETLRSVIEYGLPLPFYTPPYVWMYIIIVIIIAMTMFMVLSS